jgi:anti-anti-sigma regulatory factor
VAAGYQEDAISNNVSAEQSITVGVFEGFSWIRCEGKGSFLNSPVVKVFGDSRIAAGENVLVVDLLSCTGMDSTFMGTLAGMSSRLSASCGEFLQVADPGSRNLRSLEDLGLDYLMEVNPSGALWRGTINEVRAALKPPGALASMDMLQRKRHVLESHENLSSLNPENASEFSEVLNHLRKEIDRNEKRSGEDPS